MGQFIEPGGRTAQCYPGPPWWCASVKPLPVYQPQKDSNGQDTMGIWVTVGRGKENCCAKQTSGEKSPPYTLQDGWTFLVPQPMQSNKNTRHKFWLKNRKIFTECVGPLFTFVRKTTSWRLYNDANVKFSEEKDALSCIATFNLARGVRFGRRPGDGKVRGSKGHLQSCMHVCLAYRTVEC